MYLSNQVTKNDNIKMIQNIYANPTHHKILNDYETNRKNGIGKLSIMPKMFNHISFCGAANNISFDELMLRFCGVLIKKDYRKINFHSFILSRKYDKSNLNELFIQNKTNVDNILSTLKDSGVNAEQTKKGMSFSANIPSIYKSTCKKLKKYYLDLLSVRKTVSQISDKDPLLISPTIKDWFNKADNVDNSTIFIQEINLHPIDKAKILIGNFSIEDKKQISQKSSFIKQKKIPPTQLELQKQRILNKIIEVISSKKITRNKLYILKKYAVQYQALDDILDKNRIFSKEIETVAANGDKILSQTKIGDFIDGIGFIVQKTTVYDKSQKGNVSCLVAFNKEKKDFSFKLIRINEEHEKTIVNFVTKYKNVKKNLSLQRNNQILLQVNELKDEARKILEEWQDIVIAKVHFNMLPLEKINGFLQEINDPQCVETLLNTIKAEKENVSKIPVVVDFVNLKPERYYDAGRKVVLPLIHLLKEHECNNIVMKALAIGENKKSPLLMYLRAGFVPVSPTMEQIKQMTENFHKPFDPKIPVFMYLPNNATVNKIVEKERPLSGLFPQ